MLLENKLNFLQALKLGLVTLYCVMHKHTKNSTWNFLHHVIIFKVRHILSSAFFWLL
jgi:hypothetical protein